MLSEGEKSRNATLAGYFAKEYIRAFEGDAYSDPVRLRRQARMLSKEKNLGKDWVPSQGIKLPSVYVFDVIITSRHESSWLLFT